MKHQPTVTAWPGLAAILLSRLAVLWLLVFVSLLMPAGDTVFYAFMAIAFIITIPYSLWLKNRIRNMQFAPLQFAVDVVMVSGLVYFTGGTDSQLTLLYPLVILSAGIVGTLRQTVEITFLATTLYVLMAVLLSSGMIAQYAPSGSLVTTHSGWVGILLQSIMFVLFGIAGSYIAKRCRLVHAQERTLEECTSAILENLPAPTLLIDPSGRLIMANRLAQETLQYDAQELTGKTFTDLCQITGKEIPALFGRTTYLARKQTHPLPVAFDTREFQIPKRAIRGFASQDATPVKITLLIFNDLSRELKTHRQLEKVERITSATRIAGEMAHEIQEPLTSLSASLQLLRHYEEKTTAADWLPNSPRRKDRKELFKLIDDASQRMESALRNFLDFAEFSPSDLLSIIKLDSSEENQGYISHLNTIGRG